MKHSLRPSPLGGAIDVLGERRAGMKLHFIHRAGAEDAENRGEELYFSANPPRSPRLCGEGVLTAVHAPRVARSVMEH